MGDEFAGFHFSCVGAGTYLILHLRQEDKVILEERDRGCLELLDEQRSSVEVFHRASGRSEDSLDRQRPDVSWHALSTKIPALGGVLKTRYMLL